MASHFYAAIVLLLADIFCLAYLRKHKEVDLQVNSFGLRWGLRGVGFVLAYLSLIFRWDLQNETEIYGFPLVFALAEYEAFFYKESGRLLQVSPMAPVLAACNIVLLGYLPTVVRATRVGRALRRDRRKA